MAARDHSEVGQIDYSFAGQLFSLNWFKIMTFGTKQQGLDCCSCNWTPICKSYRIFMYLHDLYHMYTSTLQQVCFGGLLDPTSKRSQLVTCWRVLVYIYICVLYVYQHQLKPSSMGSINILARTNEAAHTASNKVCVVCH